MFYDVEIRGTRPLLMHNGAAGLDTWSPENVERAEIARTKGSNRTVADEQRMRELECQVSLYLDTDGKPTIPAAVIRAAIEGAARKLKQGPQVREGLVVESINSFVYDEETLGTTKEEIGKNAQFTVGVVVQRQRILRTRAQFYPWSLHFTVEVDKALVDQRQLTTWLEIAGKRLGIGDWRPEKSGDHGRFDVVSVKGRKS